MSITYTPATNFGAKDSLPTNDPDKVIKGVDFTTEFSAIQTAFTLAAPIASPTFTGTVTIASVDINGGTIDGVTVGGASAGAGSFTTLTADGLTVNGAGTITNTVASQSSALTLQNLNTGAYGTGISFENNYLGTTFESASIKTGVGDQDGYLQFYTTGAGTSKKRLQLDNNGDISFYEDTGTTAKFFWDASAERLGIGTSSPAYKLEIAASQPWIRLNDTDGTTAYAEILTSSGSLAFSANPLTTGVNSDITFSTDGAEAMRIDSSGAVTMESTGVAKAGMPINTESGTSITLALAENGNYIRCTSASATTVTVPPNSSVAFPVGAGVVIFQAGAGQVTIAAGSGVTLNSKDSNLNISAQYAAVTCKKVATDTWDVIGDLSS